MDLLKHIQLVHLRQSWIWTQNLWNPSDITYMTAPVTWFSLDVLAGALFLIGALFSFSGRKQLYKHIRFFSGFIRPYCVRSEKKFLNLSPHLVNMY